MFTALKKIHKDKDVEPSEFEETVAQVVLVENINLGVFFTGQRYCTSLSICPSHDCMSMQALFDLENTNSELKSDLKDLYINSALWGSLVDLCNMFTMLIGFDVSHYAIVLCLVVAVKLMFLETGRPLLSMFLLDWGRHSARFSWGLFVS